MRKILLILITLCLTLLPFRSIYGDECDEECNGEGATRVTCNVCKEEAARKRIEEINKEIDAAEANRDEANALAVKFGEQIEGLEAEIEALQPEIDALQIRIDELLADIEANNKKVDDINNRILNRMANAQATMHFNPLLDFLLGSSGFADFLRRSYGLEAITGKEEDDIDELRRIIEKLNIDKDECDENKYQLEQKQNEMEAKKQEADLLRSYYNKRVEEINQEIFALMDESAQQQMIISSLVYNIEDLLAMPRQTYFIHPVSNASISAGMPYYPASFGGGMHIGIDYAAKYDTPILAPADGVIISSVNTCSLDTGNHLGDRCGGVSGKGMAAGGNQVRMMVSVNGVVYGLIFFHMRQYDVHAEGVVTAGTMIGRVGSSGNSTGAHCHIELFYLGEGEAADIPAYLNKGYTVGFNLGYNLASLCSARGGVAPCRLDGRDYFGK